MDARGGESDSQHILLSGDVVRGSDAVQVSHVAEGEEGQCVLLQEASADVTPTADPSGTRRVIQIHGGLERVRISLCTEPGFMVVLIQAVAG